MIYIDNGSQGISSDENESSSYVLPDQIDSVKHLMHDEEGMIVVGDDDSETVGDQFVMVPPNMAEGPGMLYDQLENENSAKDTGSAEISSEENGVLSQYMDIQEPLSSLKILLENRLKIDLTGCTYWLQDTQLLEADRNLVEQCVHGEGLVQINYQVKMENGKFKINIVDVLKPAEEYVEISPEVSTRIEENDDKSEAERPDMVRWIIDSNFRKEQERLNIPQDPKDWSKAQVRHWLLWAVRQFNLTKIQLPDWDITGEELVQITLDDFRKKVPLDPNDHFWTHLELLRKCKFSAIIAKKNDSEEAEGRKVTSIENVSPPAFDQTERLSVIEKKANLSAESEKEEKSPSKKIPRALGSIKQKGCIRISKSKSNKILFVQEMNTASGKTGNNGQIQLWQFLLDLLTDKRHRQSIQWQGEDGEFKLIDPEVVANLWGERKNKPTMNYEKLSRALRYYYEGDMISKVQGKRFVYKFVCDLKALLGYSAAKLNKLVIEAELNARSNDSNVGVDELMEMQF